MPELRKERKEQSNNERIHREYKEIYGLVSDEKFFWRCLDKIEKIHYFRLFKSC
jgi:hypothetical protein